MASTKKLPNILITGTPGCGKTLHCARLQELINFKFFNISDMVKEKKFYSHFDETFQTFITDEDKVLDELEGPIAEGGIVVDFHTCDFFPERFFQLVVVLRCDNKNLYDRLVSRGYSEIKIEENMSAEITEVVLQSAEDSYAPEVVVVLQSNEDDEVDSNVQGIVEWINAYMTNTQEDDDEDGGF